MPAAAKHKTVCTPVGSLFYEVGPDIHPAADTFRAKQLHGVYRESPEYMARLRGALSMMKVPHIDLLVVRLPVALPALEKAALEKAMTASHEIAAGRTITLRKTLAVGHPQGALVHCAAEHERMASIGMEQRLVIDPRSRTFDWLVCRGMRLVQKQSHSINRRMSDVLHLMAADISKDIGTPDREYDAIDLVLHTGKAPGIFQKPYAMSRHLPIAESVPRQVVSTMRQWIETPESLHNSIFVDGGSFLFKKAVKAAFPEQRIHDVREPLYANVMGFQLVRQNQVMTSFAPPVTSDSATGGRCKSAQEWRPHRPIPLAFGLSRAEKPPLFDELSQFPQGRRRVDRLPR